jgi:hypothetical protein
VRILHWLDERHDREGDYKEDREDYESYQLWELLTHIKS